MFSIISKKRLIIFVGITLIVIAGGFILFSRSQDDAVKFIKAERKDLISEITASGTLTGKESVDLRFKTGGKLTALYFKEGDTVTKGQVIAQLDTQELDIRLQQAKNDLALAEANLDKVYDEVKGHDTDETFELRLKRTEAEQKKNNAYDAVKAAQRAYQDAVIISPISGIITQANFLPGQFVGPSDVIVQIIDPSEAYFEANIDELDIAKIQIGQKAVVSLDAYPDKTFSGTVDYIKPITKTTSSGTTVSPIRVKIENPDIRFIAGLNGQVRIVVEKAENALVVPAASLLEDTYLIVKNGISLEKIKVETGVIAENEIEIKQGLTENQMFAQDPSQIRLDSGGFFLNGLFRSN